MKNTVVVVIFAILFLVGLMIGTYFITAKQPSSSRMMFVYKAAFIYVLSVLILMLMFVVNMNVNIRILSDKQHDLQRILFDIRDGTKSFHMEKRSVARVYGEIAARVYAKDFEEYVEVLNAGYSGALLRCTKDIQPETIINLKMYLPIFPQPIDIKARVLRSAIRQESGKALAYDVAIKYTVISDIDKEKLIETVDALHEKQAKA